MRGKMLRRARVGSACGRAKMPRLGGGRTGDGWLYSRPHQARCPAAQLAAEQAGKVLLRKCKYAGPQGRQFVKLSILGQIENSNILSKGKFERTKT